MATIATLFSGGEGVGVGAKQAGIDHLWGIEMDDAIASVARLNGFHSITADVMTVDPTGLEVPDVLHASPVCKRASNANQSAELNEDGTKETLEDIAAGEKIAQFIEVMQPRIFTLENAYAYRNFKAFKSICAALSRDGYMWDFDNLNAADYGGWELCPIHHFVNYAGNHLVREIAPDIVAVSAMMRPDDQARILAWDVVANLDRATQQDIAESAVWQRLAKEDNLEQIILTGRADEALMNAGTLGLKYTDEINGNIAWLLRRCLDAPSVRSRWYIISTEIKRITVLKILQCFLATKSIFHTITNKEEYQSQNGKSGTGGIECPLCRYSAVPQTRRRLILRAVRGALLPNLARPERWVGWYEAIEDLLPTLPVSQFAKWQLARLPEEIKDHLITRPAKFNPAEERGNGYYFGSQAAPTVMPYNSVQRAFILDCQLAGDTQGRGVTLRQGDASIFTVTSGKNGKQPVRAFLVSDQSAHASDGIQVINESEPGFPIRAGENGGGYPKAYLVDQTNYRGDEGKSTIRQDNDPAWSIPVYSPKHPAPRAWLPQGRVVSMTPRALARFQSFPDSYLLPDNKKLACMVIGNAVPPLLYQKIIRQLI